MQGGRFLRKDNQWEYFGGRVTVAVEQVVIGEPATEFNVAEAIFYVEFGLVHQERL